MKVLPLDLHGRTLEFHEVALEFSASDLQNIFCKKNNKTLAQTIQTRRYEHLSDVVYLKYFDFLNTPLGEFLGKLKSSGDEFYKRFLNSYGDLEYCIFSIGRGLKLKGLYSYVVDEQLRYMGRCRDTFEKRINYGYGRISAKNCFLDGQSTNCHLNALINRYRTQVEFYVYPLVDNAEIEQWEKLLIQQYQPEWNIALKAR